jgi:hypothetical protein
MADSAIAGLKRMKPANADAEKAISSGRISKK